MKKLAISAVAVLFLWTARAGAEAAGELARHMVTAQIKAGIEKHIETEAAKGGGFYRLSAGGKDYLFKLVRVHTEYLSRLEEKRHFACVDLVDEKGDVYDVDFFLAGDPDAMTVTETTLHKLNGIPYYGWKKDEGGNWRRVPIEGAKPELLGVRRERDAFDFLYRVILPEISVPAKMWIPVPQTDSLQTVELLGIESPKPPRTLDEKRFGNRALYFEFGPEDGGKTVDVRYRVERAEKAAYADPDPDRETYLAPEKMVPLNEDFARIAAEVTKDKKGDLVRARALYDHVMDEMRYMKHGAGWGKGDAVYACSIKTGNCTDFHSYFIALARSVGIPARFAVGVAVPSDRNDGGIDGYHCWAEFHAEGKWWPVDISEADKYSSLSTYYFGHHPANRLEFTRGRDLEFDPAPASGPVNFHAYPVLEAGGEPVKPKTEFYFERRADSD